MSTLHDLLDAVQGFDRDHPRTDPAQAGRYVYLLAHASREGTAYFYDRNGWTRSVDIHGHVQDGVT